MARREDLDELAVQLRNEGLTNKHIAGRLGVHPSMLQRRIVRHARKLREAKARGMTNDSPSPQPAKGL